ncbi:MAG TPA: aspartate aminotransferase family protein [Lacipirellulaceae bacterium]|nr:aspartate aminotransferase family protein [Lacipirellulaceae bacterium]
MMSHDPKPRAHSRSQKLLADNEQVIPGGLASINRRAEPCIAFAKAKGSRLWDIDGHEYIDYHAAFSAYILGHADPDVDAAVIAALHSGRSNYGSGPTADEGELARLFLRCVPTAEKVQFFNTGSEATAQAIRVARAATGRDHVILMQGGYNGNQNVVAANLMNTPEQLGGKQIVGDEYPLIPLSAGIPAAERALMHAVEFNNLAAVRTLVERYEVAALITEPVLQNIGVVMPRPGYLEGLRELADRYGFALILDEVKTGFRSSLGGYQGLSGVTADLSTFGKALANGYPIAALAGKRNFMDLAVSADPAKRVLVAGTYNCHPVPVAAAHATLTKLSDSMVNVYGQLESRAQQLEEGQRRLFRDHGVTATISRVGSAHCVYFMDHAPANWWELITAHDAEFDLRYRRALIDHGVYHFPVASKQGSISFAHSEGDIEATLEATQAVLAGFSS